MTPATITPPPKPNPAPLSASPPAVSASGGWTPFRWTVDEYRQLGSLGMFADVKVMLLNGVIYTMPSPNPPHDIAHGLTEDWLRSIIPPGHHVRSQKSFNVGTKHGPEPDLAVVAGAIRDYTKPPTTAVLVVEVSHTTLSTDTTEKAEVYATAGVPEYWVLDVENRKLLVYRNPEPLPAGLGATAYRTHLTFGEAESVAPLAAPGSPVKVADLLP